MLISILSAGQCSPLIEGIEEMSNPDQVYIGRREAIHAEVGTPEYYAGKYLVQIIGDGELDATGFDTMDEARAEADELATVYPGIQIVVL